MPTPITITTRTWLKAGLSFPVMLVVTFSVIFSGEQTVLDSLAIPCTYLVPYVFIAIIVYFTKRSKSYDYLKHFFWRLSLYLGAGYGIPIGLFCSIIVYGKDPTSTTGSYLIIFLVSFMAPVGFFYPFYAGYIALTTLLKRASLLIITPFSCQSAAVTDATNQA